jgi:type IV fimbrial biogenesis protein FimT
MLVNKRNQSGFTLIELMVAVAVMIILATIAVPAFQTMMKNFQIRNAAESINNGMQKARAEAIGRNKNVEFVLGTNSAWTVQLNDGTTVTNIESRSEKEGSTDVTRVTVPSSATTVTFNALGGVTTNITSGAVTLTRVTLSATGGNKNLLVDVGASGKIKMCNPNLTTGSSPQAC